MQRLLNQLEELTLDGQQRTQLQQLSAPISDCIAVATHGDRPNAFAKAIPIIEKIRSDKALFEKDSASEAAFPIVEELRDLIQSYADFAQIR
jgi:hypothetical protein